jgi:hypothetical protein
LVTHCPPFLLLCHSFGDDDGHSCGEDGDSIVGLNIVHIISTRCCGDGWPSDADVAGLDPPPRSALYDSQEPSDCIDNMWIPQEPDLPCYSRGIPTCPAGNASACSSVAGGNSLPCR